MRVWRRWLPSDRPPVDRPLAPIRGTSSNNTLIRLYAHPGSSAAAKFIDGIDGTVRRFVKAPAVDDGSEFDGPDEVVAIQLVPVAPEMQSTVARRSQEVRRTLTAISSEVHPTNADLAEIGHFVANRGGWSPLVEYLQWLYTRDDPSQLSHDELYAAVDRLDADAETGMVEASRDRDAERDLGLNAASARQVLERGLYADHACAGTVEWIRTLPDNEDVAPEDAVVYVNGECLRSVTDDALARMIRATRRMFRDPDAESRRRRVEELVRDE